MNFLKRIFGFKEKEQKPIQSQLKPKDWNKTISDLMTEMKEGKRPNVGPPEIGWAIEYERELIPNDYRFPKKGDVYESIFDQNIEFLTAWQAPFTGGGNGTLLKGEQIWIVSDSDDKKPISINALPVKYQEIEKRMVSETDRQSPKFGNLYFNLSTISLNENFKLIKTRFKKKPLK